MAQKALLDHYDLGDVIGHGSFGVIRKVRRKADRQILALKDVKYQKLIERDRIKLVNEVNLLRELNHPMIVKYYERIHEPSTKTIHIVMEYCEGGDLMTLIQTCKERHMRIPEDNIWDLFSQLVVTLQYCHHEHFRLDEKGNREQVTILHRDLKPENVFLDKSQTNIKLGDFGLSKCMNSRDGYLASSFVGTPFYMSPEIMQGAAYDTKSDIWALGCVVYELCMLRPPFDANSPGELAEKIAKGNYTPLEEVYSRDLDYVVGQMLQQNPRARPTAQDLRAHPRVSFAMRLRELAQMSALLKARENKQSQLEKELQEMYQVKFAKLQAWEEDLKKRESAFIKTGGDSEAMNTRRRPLDNLVNEAHMVSSEQNQANNMETIEHKTGRKPSMNSTDLRKVATSNSVRRKQSLINIAVSGPPERVLAKSANDENLESKASFSAAEDPATLFAKLALATPSRYCDDDDTPSPFLKKGLPVIGNGKVDKRTQNEMNIQKIVH